MAFESPKGLTDHWQEVATQGVDPARHPEITTLEQGRAFLAASRERKQVEQKQINDQMGADGRTGNKSNSHDYELMLLDQVAEAQNRAALLAWEQEFDTSTAALREIYQDRLDQINEELAQEKSAHQAFLDGTVQLEDGTYAVTEGDGAFYDEKDIRITGANEVEAQALYEKGPGLFASRTENRKHLGRLDKLEQKSKAATNALKKLDEIDEKRAQGDLSAEDRKALEAERNVLLNGLTDQEREIYERKVAQQVAQDKKNTASADHRARPEGPAEAAANSDDLRSAFHDNDGAATGDWLTADNISTDLQPKAAFNRGAEGRPVETPQVAVQKDEAEVKVSIKHSPDSFTA